MSAKSEKRLVERYLAEYDVEKVVNEVLNVCLRERPDDPFALIAQLLKEKSKAGKGILGVKGRVIVDCAGKKACEIQIDTGNGEFVAQVSMANIPCAFKRVSATNFTIASKNLVNPALTGKDPIDLESIDQSLLALDDTDDKSKIGINTIYAASIAACRAGASAKDISVYQHLAQIASKKEFAIPVPWIIAVDFPHEQIGLVPVGADSFREAIDMVSRVLSKLEPLHLEQNGDFKNAIEKVLQVLENMELNESIRLAISVKDDPLEPYVDEAEMPDDAELQDKEGKESETAEEGNAAESADDSSKGKKGKVEEQKEQDQDQEGKEEEPKFDRASTRLVVSELLEEETTQNSIVIVENIFNPGQSKAMENFVEEYGELVVLFNTIGDISEQEDDLDINGEGDGQVPAKEENAGDGDDAAGDESKQGDKEGDQSDKEEKNGSENESKSQEGSDKEKNASDDEQDDFIPACNGDKLIVGAPFADVCTISDLIQECELYQTQGQAVAVVWEETNGVLDHFAADFSVALSTGLVKVGFLDKPSNAVQVNQLLRLEEELGTEAFYAASRFRCPF